jgi:hypothetical protein
LYCSKNLIYITIKIALRGGVDDCYISSNSFSELTKMQTSVVGMYSANSRHAGPIYPKIDELKNKNQSIQY